MSQKTLLLHEAGKPLVLGERAIPKPSKNQLLVKVLVAGLNPHDQRTRDHGLFVSTYPSVLASDIVGEVLTIGDGNESATFHVGEQVFGHTMSEGGWDNDFNAAQQYALVDASGCAGCVRYSLRELWTWIPPPPFSPEAKTFDFENITLLVVGGGSNTGRAVIELAALSGIGRIIAVAGPSNEATLRSIGATHVVDRHARDALDQIRAITGDHLIHAIDTVNTGLAQELGVAALSNSKKGTLITLRRPGEELDRYRIGSKTACYERRLVFSVSPEHPEVTVPFWKEVSQWIKEGKVRPSRYEIIKGLDADAVNKALDRYPDGEGCKVNIHPWG